MSAKVTTARDVCAYYKKYYYQKGNRSALLARMVRAANLFNKCNEWIIIFFFIYFLPSMTQLLAYLFIGSWLQHSYKSVIAQVNCH